MARVIDVAARAAYEEWYGRLAPPWTGLPEPIKMIWRGTVAAAVRVMDGHIDTVHLGVQGRSGRATEEIESLAMLLEREVR